MTVNDKVRELMSGKYRQKEMLVELKKRGNNMSQSSLSKKLRNKIDISFEELRIFADILGKDISFFIN